jgi:hypothetical protein
MISEILYEYLSPNFIDAKQDVNGNWSVALEYVKDDGSIQKTNMTITEFDVFGTDPQIAVVKRAVRRYMRSYFDEEYKRDLCDYEMKLDFERIAQKKAAAKNAINNAKT